MGTLSIHSLDPEVERLIRLKARRENKSINQTLKELLTASVGRSPAAPSDRGSDFDEFLGIWSERDVREFRAATEDFEAIDERDWR